MRVAVGFLVLAFVLVTVPGVLAEDAGVILLQDRQVFVSPSRAAVGFPHEEHWGFEGLSCLDCHHDWKGGENVLDLGALTPGSPAARCGSCHRSPATLQASFHLLCIGCHDATKKPGRPGGPRTCGGCHPWR